MKRMRLLSIVFLAIWSIWTTSCKKEEENQTKTNEIPITLSGGIKGVKTRAVDATWGENDCIGLHTFHTGTTDFAHGRHNHRYTTTRGDGYFDCASGNPIYYPLDGAEIDLRGYYPYDPEMEESCLANVDVSNQSDLSAINLMTFDCFKAASKKNPNVSVTFKHRLTKLIFNIRHEDPDKEVRIKNILIKGMKTTGKFCLFKEQLFIDSDSDRDINLSASGTTAQAIVLPREAQEGIHLTFISEDDVEFTALMSADQQLKAGYKYTFNVELRDKEVPIVIKGIIQDWTDGGPVTVDSHPVIIGTGGGPSTGFKPDDVITLYHDDLEITKFKYDGAKWTPETPLYWENIGDGYSKHLTLRAEFVRTPAIHTSQLDEVMLAEVNCERFQDITLPFTLVPAKVVFELISEANEPSQRYSQSQLDEATLLLPGYITEYTITNGVFTPGTLTGDVTVVDNTALILPQEKTGTIAQLTIAGNTYVLSGNSGITFEKGKVTKIKVNVIKTGVNGFGASYTDWIWDGTETKLTTLSLTTPGTTTDFVAGDKLSLYYDDLLNTKRKIGDFQYQGSNQWTTTPAVYWETIDPLAAYNFYAVSTLKSAPIHSNQMDDVMYAEHTGVSKFGSVNLAFTKKTAKIEIILKETGTFSEAELESANIILPSYAIGAKFDGWEYKTGITTGNIIASKTSEKLKWEVLIEPQTIKKGNHIITVNINGNPYHVVRNDDNTVFDVAKRYIYRIEISKAGLEFNASYSTWVHDKDEDQDIEIELD